VEYFIMKHIQKVITDFANFAYSLYELRYEILPYFLLYILLVYLLGRKFGKRRVVFFTLRYLIIFPIVLYFKIIFWCVFTFLGLFFNEHGTKYAMYEMSFNSDNKDSPFYNGPR